jgi:hypothetical protein
MRYSGAQCVVVYMKYRHSAIITIDLATDQTPGQHHIQTTETISKPSITQLHIFIERNRDIEID